MKTAKTIFLVLLLATAGILLIHYLRSLHAIPPEVQARSITRIDSKSFEEFTQTLGEWDKAGEQDGMFRNPKTGEFTVTEEMTCKACGAKIPAPSGLAPKGATEAEWTTFVNAYRCPKCAKPPAGEVSQPLLPVAHPE